MKKQLTIISGIMALMVLAAFTTITDSDGFYRIDTEKSVITWHGSKITGKTHSGTVKLIEGGLQIMGNQIDGGKFTIDMTTIDVTDLEGSMKSKLESHLKSDDFFGVREHKTAQLAIVKVDGNSVTANLTIKGRTHQVTFPAKLEFNAAGSLIATASIEVDRSKYDVRYGSGSFFDDLGNKAINDIIKFDVKLVGTK